MIKIKQYIAKKAPTFYYAYTFLGYRIFLCLALSIFAGILDGFGLAMFLPLLQIASGDVVDGESLGRLSFLVDGISNLGLDLNLVTIFLFMISFFVLKGAFTYLSSAYRIILQQSFVKKIRVNLLSALNKMTFKAFVKSDSGQIQNTMSGEVDRITNGFGHYLNALQHGVVVLVYMFFAFTIDFGFAIIVSIGGLLTNFLFSYLYKKTKRVSRSLTNYNNIYQGQIIQHVSFFKYLKATNLAKKSENRLKETIHKIEGNRKKMGLLNSIMLGAREPILIIVIAASIVIQINFFNSALSALFVSLIFFYRALNSVSAMQTAWNMYLSTIGSFENIKQLQKNFDDNKENTIGEISINSFNKIELKEVDLFFDDKKIIDNLSLEIKAKTTVAFIGESGSGKSTLINLIAGLIPADGGDIKIDDKSYRDINLNHLQSRIGYITQEPIVFNDTIYNNITLWAEKNDENLNRFHEVLRKASIDDFISGLPKKEETELGNSGITLSGGQKQRIAIARELFKDIDILIMDEATSALDSLTEKEIQQNIESLKGQYTILIAAHRLSTIKHADKIAILDKGTIEDEGTFDELIKFNKSFKLQVEAQNL